MARMTYLSRPTVIALCVGASIILTACDETTQGGLFGQVSSEPHSGETTIETRVEERDVERPDIFETTDLALWDGRPSLGGVWVAHPDVSAPERVRVTNTDTGTTIEAALFRRERDLPGPLIQVSSDAAQKLGILAGTPTNLNIIAMRREEVTIEEVVPVPGTAPEDTDEVPESLDQAALEETEAPAKEALDKEEAPEADSIATAAAAAIAAANEPQEAADTQAESQEAKPLFPLSKPFIQVGIFSVEANALDAAQSLNDAGMEPLISQDLINDKTFWRVVIGPATNRKQRSEMLNAVKEAGFQDAYYVKE